jgi:hypothetical protein
MKRDVNGSNKKLEQAKKHIRKGEWKQMFCLDRKKAWMNNKISQIEYNLKRNDTRKFFQEIKIFKTQQIILPTTCKNTRGNTISQIDDVLARWKEYFQNILSVPTAPERLQLTSERTDNYDKIAPPAYNEICSIINKLKTNKAAGTDNISGELIKHGRRTL